VEDCRCFCGKTASADDHCRYSKCHFKDDLCFSLQRLVACPPSADWPSLALARACCKIVVRPKRNGKRSLLQVGNPTQYVHLSVESPPKKRLRRISVKTSFPRRFEAIPLTLEEGIRVRLWSGEVNWPKNAHLVEDLDGKLAFVKNSAANLRGEEDFRRLGWLRSPTSPDLTAAITSAAKLSSANCQTNEFRAIANFASGNLGFLQPSSHEWTFEKVGDTLLARSSESYHIKDLCVLKTSFQAIYRLWWM